VYPDLSPIEQGKKTTELNEKNLIFGPLPFDTAAIIRNKMPEFGQVFVELAYAVLSKQTKRRCAVYFRPFDFKNQGEWSVEG
jgi:hypothetical protein